jgi:putative hydrolase of HD superfamily
MGIIKGESISDHMYRMSIMTMMAPTSITSTLDLPKCTKMALVHDMAEALVGDITPNDRVDKEEKSRREEETMDYICGKLLGGISGLKSVQEVRSAWQEYEDSKTAESIFVHDIDKMELLLQMVEYERKFECAVNLGEFAWVATKIHMPEIREWGKEVLLERVGLWKGAGKTPSWPNRPLERERFLEWAKEQGIPISA